MAARRFRKPAKRKRSHGLGTLQRGDSPGPRHRPDDGDQQRHRQSPVLPGAAGPHRDVPPLLDRSRGVDGLHGRRDQSLLAVHRLPSGLLPGLHQPDEQGRKLRARCFRDRVRGASEDPAGLSEISPAGGRADGRGPETVPGGRPGQPGFQTRGRCAGSHRGRADPADAAERPRHPRVRRPPPATGGPAGPARRRPPSSTGWKPSCARRSPARSFRWLPPRETPAWGSSPSATTSTRPIPCGRSWRACARRCQQLAEHRKMDNR